MLIAEKGYAAVTVKNIYERAEVSKMTFYRHFGSINALEEEVKNNLLSALNGFINVLKEAQHVTDLNETFFYIEKKLINAVEKEIYD